MLQKQYLNTQKLSQRDLCVFNTYIDSAEAKSAKNKIVQVLEGGQINVLECIKRDFPIFWRPKPKIFLTV